MVDITGLTEETIRKQKRRPFGTTASNFCKTMIIS